MVIFSTSGKTQWKHTPQIWEQLRHLVKIEVTVDKDFWSNRSHTNLIKDLGQNTKLK